LRVKVTGKNIFDAQLRVIFGKALKAPYSCGLFKEPLTIKIMMRL
jgi:hypothetical protein